jgi:hypothetical protein
MMVGMGMKVSISTSLFPINLVGEGSIRKLGDKNIQRGKHVILLDFHSKFDVRGNTIKMVKERDKSRMTMGPNNKGVIYKWKLALVFEMKAV